MARQSKYPEEFRRQAAALVLDSGRAIRDVARELDVNHETFQIIGRLDDPHGLHDLWAKTLNDDL